MYVLRNAPSGIAIFKLALTSFKVVRLFWISVMLPVSPEKPTLFEEITPLGCFHGSGNIKGCV